MSYYLTELICINCNKSLGLTINGYDSCFYCLTEFDNNPNHINTIKSLLNEFVHNYMHNGIYGHCQLHDYVVDKTQNVPLCNIDIMRDDINIIEQN